MANEPRDAALSLSLPSTVAAPATVSPDLEAEVVDLFDQLRDPLLRYLLSIGMPVQDGEEIVQEAFLALFQHLRRNRSRRNLRGWLFRVAHNLALKRARNGRNQTGPADASGEIVVADPAPNPEDQAVDQQTQARLAAVLQALPEQDRQCLALRAEGLRQREIAAALGMSLGAVSLSLTRSLARMARAADR
jgi:RNA polymerase sigma-70 factor, ECF subfamily